MEEKIRIENVTKKFGSYAALDGISLSFEKGKIHGMIGRNGSGKTVLFKCICGFLRVDDGAVFVDGKQIGKEIWVFRNETYGREVFRCRDPRIEVLTLVFFSAAVLCFLYA